MPRIRTIKPEFAQSEAIGRLTRDARLLFVQLWTLCDDHGCCRAAVPVLAGQLYAYDNDAAELLPGWLAELEREGFVGLYEVEGSRYLAIVGWAKHQRVDNAGKRLVPPPPSADPEPENEARGDSPQSAADRGESRLDLGPRPRTTTKDQGAPAAAARRARGVARPDEVPEQAWADWLAVRKAKRAGPVTKTVLAAVEREAKAAGITLADAIQIAAERGWQSIKADWLSTASNGNGTTVPKNPNPGYYDGDPVQEL